MSRILVLMMSSKAAPIFQNEVDAAYETWASDCPDDIDVKYYDGSWPIKKPELTGNHLKLNSQDGLDYTFLKTCDAVNYFLHNSHYDYILRTNTSTYINLKLLKELDNLAFFEPDKVYGTDLYSLTEAAAPIPLDIYCRGNCIMMHTKKWEEVIEYGLALWYLNVVDDVSIGNIFNSINYWKGINFIDRGKNYIENIVGLPHGWYHCVIGSGKNNHSVTTYYGTDDMNVYAQCLTIQTKMYRQRSNEIENLKEFHEKFKDIKTDSTIAIKYSENPDIFIGSILGYIPLDKWKQISRKDLYVFEMNHKASDDKQSPNFKQELYDQLHSLS